jgi:hypothetical protein
LWKYTVFNLSTIAKKMQQYSWTVGKTTIPTRWKSNVFEILILGMGQERPRTIFKE